MNISFSNYTCIFIIYHISFIRGGFLLGLLGGGGEDGSQGEENVGTTTLTTTDKGLFKFNWDKNPFDTPINADQNFSTLQAVLTTPLYEKELTQDPSVDSQKAAKGTLKPKDFSVLILQEFGAMESGEVNFSQGPLKIRLRWSPDMLAAGAIYALLKIQDTPQDIKEPEINQVKEVLYRIDDPSFILKYTTRRSQAFRWVLQQARALSHAFWYYRRFSKYAPDTPIEHYLEHVELRKSLKNFVGDQKAQDFATDIIGIFKKHRYPMNPINMLQVIKSKVAKLLRNSGDNLDVARYECSIIPGSTGSNLGNSNFKMNCIKEFIIPLKVS
jgi:hypothetical protein